MANIGPGAGVRSLMLKTAGHIARPPVAAYDLARDRMAAQLRTTYVKLKAQNSNKSQEIFERHIPSWDGGRDSYSRMHQPAWPKLADLLLKHGCDPVMFLRAQVTSGKLAPPGSLCNVQAINRYTEFLAANMEDEPLRFTAQVRELKLALLRADALFAGKPEEYIQLAAVTDPMAKMSPLFRYCTGKSLMLFEVHSYHDAALDQLLANYASIVKHWDSILDDALVQEAEIIRNAARS